MADDQRDSVVNETEPAAEDAPASTAATPEGNLSGDAERITELERQVADLERQVERERDQATDYMRRWHTAQADFANYKRRAQQEQEQRDRLLAAQALAPTMNALDSLERAFMALPTTLRGFTWIEGIALVELQLRRALELQGIRVIEAEPGQAFDPARHEPIGEVESDAVAEGAIVVVAQRGYESQGLLIRPALVQIARKPSAAPDPEINSVNTGDASDGATETKART